MCQINVLENILPEHRVQSYRRSSCFITLSTRTHIIAATNNCTTLKLRQPLIYTNSIILSHSTCTQHSYIKIYKVNSCAHRFALNTGVSALKSSHSGLCPIPTFTVITLHSFPDFTLLFQYLFLKRFARQDPYSI